ncbi:MAG TPA: glycosyltransferase, partial [Gemmatimonadales bacterium]|nr:glycosyltransferase [Gemmatimonadales bacterium]
CPVVTTDRYGTKELAEGAAVLVDPESVEGIADGIRQVLDDTPRRAELIAAGRTRSAGFQWRRCAAETLGVLERVAAERRPVRRSPVERTAAARHA